MFLNHYKKGQYNVLSKILGSQKNRIELKLRTCGNKHKKQQNETERDDNDVVDDVDDVDDDDDECPNAIFTDAVLLGFCY